MSDKKLAERYKEFSFEVLHNFRFRLSDESEAFLSEIVSLASTHVTVLDKGENFYRARTNDVIRSHHEIYPDPNPFPPEKMKPIPNVVGEGRANPHNICALYLSDSIGGALAEVRPGRNVPVTVGVFEAAKELRIVEFENFNWHAYYFCPRGSDEEFWFTLSDDFSRPTNSHDQPGIYARTQIITECLKRSGYDGIKYSSQFCAHKGTFDSEAIYSKNIALFDLDSANCLSTSVNHVCEQHIVYKEQHPEY